MGGMETLEAGLNHYKEFGYLWVLSSGWFETNKKMYAERSTYLKTIAQDFNHTVHALHFTQGGPEDIAYNNCKAMLKLFDAAGINYKYSEAPVDTRGTRGAMTCTTWHNSYLSIKHDNYHCKIPNYILLLTLIPPSSSPSQAIKLSLEN